MLIVKRPTHKKLARERRRLRKFRKLCDEGRMTEFEIHNAYKSWRNTITKDCNACGKSIESTDRLYKELFPENEHHIREKRQDVLKSIWEEYVDDLRNWRPTFNTESRPERHRG